MARTITYSDTLSILDCGSCHIPDNLLRSLKRTGEWFWCPNGHKIHYFDDENARLKAQLDQAEADARWQSDAKERARADADHQAARARGFKGALTKTKKRIAAGVCPCCNRSFADLGRHMAGQHPDYTAEGSA